MLTYMCSGQLAITVLLWDCKSVKYSIYFSSKQSSMIFIHTAEENNFADITFKLDAAGGGGGVEWLDVDIHNYVGVPACADGVFDA